MEFGWSAFLLALSLVPPFFFSFRHAPLCAEVAEADIGSPTCDLSPQLPLWWTKLSDLVTTPLWTRVVSCSQTPAIPVGTMDVSGNFGIASECFPPVGMLLMAESGNLPGGIVFESGNHPVGLLLLIFVAGNRPVGLLLLIETGNLPLVSEWLGGMRIESVNLAGDGSVCLLADESG